VSQAIQSSFVCTKPGRYVVKATRTDTTDLLSVYVDRVKKLWTDDPVNQQVTGTLKLSTHDVVESTGTLTIERIVDELAE